MDSIDLCVEIISICGRLFDNTKIGVQSLQKPSVLATIQPGTKR